MAAINGTDGGNVLGGGIGSDTIQGRWGDDRLTGGGGQDRFVIRRGDGTDIITDFGGVGTGVRPTAAVIAEVDVLLFEGAGLTAENMLLTQQGSDLLISFEGVQDTQVVLQDFALEDLDNLQRATGAAVDLGNVLSNGQREIEDSFDVFNADQDRFNVFNPNTVTFLNNLDNAAQGRNSSDDIINAQAGDDVLTGLSGNDLLRGGTGSDTLIGADPSLAQLNLSELDGSNGFAINGSVTSVSDAGDVNGDGFDDLLIGAPSANPNGQYDAGESYVVFGSRADFGPSFNLAQLDGSNGFVINGIDAGDDSGFSVSTAGDVNGDGFDDLLIGAPQFSFGIYDFYTTGPGESYVVFGSGEGFDDSLDLAALDGSNGFIINGIGEDSSIVGGDRAGYSVSTAGDVNGDGFDDLLIGAPSANPNGQYDAGESYVVFGKAEGFDASLELAQLNGSNGFVLNGIDEYNFSGDSVSGAGDVNGDGFDELLIAGPGESYVVFGKAEGFDASLELAQLNGSNGFVLNGSVTSVSGAGDVNGDGFDDLLVGARGADPNGQYDAGESYVVFGSGEGFDASLELAELDGSNGFVINGIDEYDFSGESVSAAGDVNGDGFDDLLIGAEDADPNGQSFTGQSYVIFGRDFLDSFTVGEIDTLVGGAGRDTFLLGNGTEVFYDEGNPTTSGTADYALITDFNTQEDVIQLNGQPSNYRLGSSPSGLPAGTAVFLDNPGEDSDELIGIVQGNPNLSLDSDDFSFSVAELDLADLDGSNGFVINGIDEGDRSGRSVSTAGDFNGDGFDALLIGAPYADPNGQYDAGESYVVFGSGAGFDASLDLAQLNGSNGFVINGIDERGFLGRSVSTAGDVNGDGFDDLIVGASGADSNSKKYAGESYVVFGSGAGFEASFNLAEVDGNNGFVLNGIDEGDVSGFSVSTAGDVNGDGFDDLLIGAYGADPNGQYNAGESYVVFGSGAGFEASFDLAKLNGSNGFVINGSVALVSTAGDVNGDDFDDLLIAGAGGSAVVFGKAEGFATSLDLDDLNGSNGFRFDDVRARENSGETISTAGDVNGDGLDDLLIGAYGAVLVSAVVFGKAEGFDPSFDLAQLDGSNGFLITGFNELDRLGTSVSTAGDVNGDGFDDLLIGAPGAGPNGQSRTGQSYVIFGRNFTGQAALNVGLADSSGTFLADSLLLAQGAGPVNPLADTFDSSSQLVV